MMPGHGVRKIGRQLEAPNELGAFHRMGAHSRRALEDDALARRHPDDGRGARIIAELREDPDLEQKATRNPSSVEIPQRAATMDPAAARRSTCARTVAPSRPTGAISETRRLSATLRRPRVPISTQACRMDSTLWCRPNAELLTMRSIAHRKRRVSLGESREVRERNIRRRCRPDDPMREEADGGFGGSHHANRIETAGLSGS
jgi:hypothetical protein